MGGHVPRSLLLATAVALLLGACSARDGARFEGHVDAGAEPPATVDGSAPGGCRPGARTCLANAPSVCDEDGRWMPESDACAELCHPTMGCLADDPCGRAAEAGSYIGCEYWAVPLTNTPADHLFNRFDFRIVVANTEDEPARVTVSRSGGVVATVEVAPGAAESVVLPWILELSRGVEHVGGAGEPPPSWSSLTVPTGAYLVKSDRPIVVYQFNPFHYQDEADRPGETLQQHSYSNDASLLLPVHSLGDRYTGVSMQPLSMAYRDERLAGGGAQSAHPGYLTLVGTTPVPTEVTVHPSAPIAAAADGRFPAAGPGDTLRFEVAYGEVVVLNSAPAPGCDESRPGYRLVEPSATGLAADAFCLEQAYDVTGTTIEASAPLAVFGGHACAFVPYDAWACDHLETQLPPATTLGRRTVVMPLVDTIEEAPRMSIVRVVGVIDGTRVEVAPPVDGIGSFMLDAGQMHELVIEEAHELRTSEGVLVAEFLVGQLASHEGEARRGDPAMLAVPPVEQFRNEYVFVTPTSYDEEPAFPGTMRGQSFIAIIKPGAASVSLDGEPLNDGWRPIGDHAVGTFPVAGGSHELSGDARVGLLVYGLGTHTSYAYAGGLDLEPILLF